MCGIVGYLGTKRQAYPVLIKGLKRLEYRGYDSSGVALINSNGDLNVYKAKGKVSELEAFCAERILKVVSVLHTHGGQHMVSLLQQMHIRTILSQRI